MAKDKSAVGDSYTLNADGTVTLVVAGDTIRLRRPKVGEYRTIREARWEKEDLVQAKSEETVGSTRPELRTAQRDLMALTDQVAGDWIEETVKTLGDQLLTDDRDEWPVWLITPDFAAELYKHWKSTPLGSGGR